MRLGGVASKTYLVAFPAITKHFQKQGIALDWGLYSSWDALVDAFVKGEVDLAWNGPLAYIKIKRCLDQPCQVAAMRDVDVNLVTHFITQPHSDIIAEGCKAFLPGVAEGWEVLEEVAEEEGLI
jgi:phosphonate transport system substrate-binding protein